LRPISMRTIAISNQKGGCSKTTTVVNLGAALAEQGKRTLLIDLDPQGHTTIGLGKSHEQLDQTIFDVLMDLSVPLSQITLDTNIETLKVAPCNILLAGAEVQLSTMYGNEFVLTEQLEQVKDRYDYCLIDCPPALGRLTLNALVASTDVIIPIQVHYYAMEGLRQLLEMVSLIRERFHPCSVRVLGMLLTFVQDRTTLSRQVQQQMREYFGDLVFDTVIHMNTKLAEAPSAGESVITYAPSSRGATEYMTLAEEIINRRHPAY